ncbi:MAG: peptidase [Candidatus Thermoplasmatota archaeon]
MTEIRTAIPEEIARYLDSLVRAGPFASKAELVRAALMAYATTAGPLAQGFDKETILAPDGRIYQLEYAREAALRGLPAVGVVYEGGVVLAAPLQAKSKLQRVSKIQRIGEHAAIASAGLVADADQAVRHVRQAKPKTTDDLVGEFIDFFWRHTIERTKRPLGVALLIASALDGESRLFYLDPSAALVEYAAAAIGEGEKDRFEVLERRYRRGKAKEAEALALDALGKPKAYEAVHIPV